MAKKKNATRADGRIAVQVYLGRKENGKRNYKTVYGYTQKEANEKADALKLKYKKGIDVSADRDTFTLWADRWLAMKKTEVGDKQYLCYNSSAGYLKDRLGYMLIVKVKPYDIQQIMVDLAKQNPHTKKPSSRKVLLDLKNAANQIFKLAIANRVIDYNPAEPLTMPAGAPKQQRRALSDEERERIENTPRDRAQISCMIMMYSGLRRGELIPLLWTDVNIKDKTISVSKAVEMKCGRPVVKPMTKSDAGMRTVDIPQVLVDYLSVKFSEAKSLGLVCPSSSGDMMTESSFERMMESYISDLNLKYGDFSDLEKLPTSKFQPGGVPMKIQPFTAHCLRHTFATLLYFAGVDVLTAKNQLGHADIKTTLQIYTHLDQAYKRKSMAKLDSYLSKEDASQMQVSGDDNVK